MASGGKKTRTKPIRNSEGVLIRKDGRPDMRSVGDTPSLSFLPRILQKFSFSPSYSCLHDWNRKRARRTTSPAIVQAPMINPPHPEPNHPTPQCGTSHLRARPRRRRRRSNSSSRVLRTKLPPHRHSTFLL
jgi:hypothetical protein